MRIIRITHPTPLSQPSSVELSLSPFSLRHVSDVTWGNKAGERKGEEATPSFLFRLVLPVKWLHEARGMGGAGAAAFETDMAHSGVSGRVGKREGGIA